MVAARFDTGTRKLFALSLVLVTWGEFAPCSAQAPAETREGVEVMCRVEGQSTIDSIVPEGSIVKKGQLVCELQTDKLRDELAAQQIVVKRAEAALEVAKKTRLAAEAALKEYAETTFKKELEDAKGDVAKTEDDLANMSTRIDWARRMWEQVKLSNESKLAEELAYQKTRFDLELAQIRLMTLQNLTQPRILNIKSGELKSAQSLERILQAVARLEKTREGRIRQQIDACQIVAPIDGKIVLERVEPRAMTREAEIPPRELSTLQDLVVQEKIAAQSAKAKKQEAANQVRTTELALREYTEGSLIQQLTAGMARTKQAGIELARATQNVEWSKQIVLKGQIEMPEKVLRDRWMDSAKQGLEQAQKMHNAVRTELKARCLKLLEEDIERSKARHQVAEAILELEQASEARDRAKLQEVQARLTAAAKTRAAPSELKAGSRVHQGQVLARIVLDKAPARVP